MGVIKSPGGVGGRSRESVPSNLIVWQRGGRMPFGSSLLAVARKSDRTWVWSRGGALSPIKRSRYLPYSLRRTVQLLGEPVASMYPRRKGNLSR